MKSTRIFTAILSAVAMIAMLSACHAATPQEIVTQKRTVSGIGPGADAIKARLAHEIDKILASGRLAPFRTIYGEGGLRYHWREPWQMVYALSLALPHLDAARQEKVKAYLKEEIAARPPWDLALLGPEGTKRQADDLPASVFNDMRPGEVQTPFFAYALWLYADRTGDLAPIKANWSTIKSNFNAKLGTRPNLETVSSAIGMYRLAKLVGDDATAEQMLTTATGAIEACQNFSAVISSANRVYTGRDDWRRGTRGMLYAFFNLTPEAARVLTNSPQVKNAASEYAESGWKTWPFWWMAQGPVGDWGYYGEGCCCGPEQQGMLLQYEAWVAGTPAAKLAYYTDVPDALIGDCTWIRNAVTAIEAFGDPSWR